MAKTIAIVNQKGGVGKTTTCVNLAAALKEEGARVLVCDFDPQANATSGFGVDKTTVSPNIYDVLINGADVKRAVVETPYGDVLPANKALTGATVEMIGIDKREYLLKNALAQLSDKYDYILIDTNPSMSIVNQNAFLASDAILLVSDVSMNAIEGAQLFIALWEEARKRLRREDNIKGFIVNDFDSRNKLSADYLEYLRTSPDTEDLRPILFETVIPRNVRITESELAAVPISIYDLRSKGCDAIACRRNARARRVIIVLAREVLFAHI